MGNKAPEDCFGPIMKPRERMKDGECPKNVQMDKATDLLTRGLINTQDGFIPRLHTLTSLFSS